MTRGLEETSEDQAIREGRGYGRPSEGGGGLESWGGGELSVMVASSNPRAEGRGRPKRHLEHPLYAGTKGSVTLE